MPIQFFFLYSIFLNLQKLKKTETSLKFVKFEIQFIYYFQLLLIYVIALENILFLFEKFRTQSRSENALEKLVNSPVRFFFPPVSGIRIWVSG